MYSVGDTEDSISNSRIDAHGCMLRKRRFANLHEKDKSTCHVEVHTVHVTPTNRALWGVLGGRKKGILIKFDVDDFLYIAAKSMIKAIRKGSSHAI